MENKELSKKKNGMNIFDKKSKKIKDEFSRIINNKLPNNFDKLIEESKEKIF